jgi:hypothetical protein
VVCVINRQYNLWQNNDVIREHGSGKSTSEAVPRSISRTTGLHSSQSISYLSNHLSTSCHQFTIVLVNRSTKLDVSCPLPIFWISSSSIISNSVTFSQHTSGLTRPRSHASVARSVGSRGSVRYASNLPKWSIREILNVQVAPPASYHKLACTLLRISYIAANLENLELTPCIALIPVKS